MTKLWRIIPRWIRLVIIVIFIATILQIIKKPQVINLYKSVEQNISDRNKINKDDSENLQNDKNGEATILKPEAINKETVEEPKQLNDGISKKDSEQTQLNDEINNKDGVPIIESK